MKKVKRMGYEILTQNELNVVFKILNDNIIDLKSLNWTYNLMQEILIGASEDEDADQSHLFKKLFLMTDCELVDLIIASEQFWGTEDEVAYKILNKLTPKEKFLEISIGKKQLQKYLKYDLNIMRELEFFMMSQTMENDFIVSKASSDNGFFDEKWSVNKDNFHQLLEEMTSSNMLYKVETLAKAKVDIF